MHANNGVLRSPYGYMSVEIPDDLQHRTIRTLNGHPVVDAKLVGVSLPHHVPEHWIHVPRNER